MSQQSAIRALASKRYWRETDARVAVRAWRASGKSMAAFARGVGIEEQRLRWWKARLSRGRGSAVRFHPVRVTEARAEGGAIEIHVGGCRVVAGHGVRSEDLRSVLEAIREAAAC